MKKCEMLQVFEEIRDLLNGTADPYANESEIIIQIQSKVAEVLGEESWG